MVLFTLKTLPSTKTKKKNTTTCFTHESNSTLLKDGSSTSLSLFQTWLNHLEIKKEEEEDLNEEENNPQQQWLLHSDVFSKVKLSLQINLEFIQSTLLKPCKEKFFPSITTPEETSSTWKIHIQAWLHWMVHSSTYFQLPLSKPNVTTTTTHSTKGFFTKFKEKRGFRRRQRTTPSFSLSPHDRIVVQLACWMVLHQGVVTWGWARDWVLGQGHGRRLVQGVLYWTKTFLTLDKMKQGFFVKRKKKLGNEMDLFYLHWTLVEILQQWWTCLDELKRNDDHDDDDGDENDHVEFHLALEYVSRTTLSLVSLLEDPLKAQIKVTYPFLFSFASSSCWSKTWTYKSDTHPGLSSVQPPFLPSKEFLFNQLLSQWEDPTSSHFKSTFVFALRQLHQGIQWILDLGSPETHHPTSSSSSSATTPSSTGVMPSKKDPRLENEPFHHHHHHPPPGDPHDPKIPTMESSSHLHCAAATSTPAAAAARSSTHEQTLSPPPVLLDTDVPSNPTVSPEDVLRVERCRSLGKRTSRMASEQEDFEEWLLTYPLNMNNNNNNTPPLPTPLSTFQHTSYKGVSTSNLPYGLGASTYKLDVVVPMMVSGGRATLTPKVLNGVDPCLLAHVKEWYQVCLLHYLPLLETWVHMYHELLQHGSKEDQDDPLRSKKKKKSHNDDPRSSNVLHSPATPHLPDYSLPVLLHRFERHILPVYHDMKTQCQLIQHFQLCSLVHPLTTANNKRDDDEEKSCDPEIEDEEFEEIVP
ncbi:hypothetical protein HMI54_000331 [Coelomomyces lativittatus]|nr:hypothetical protein HMI54_000331 [Coelomomyces lativittatus]KAJ1515240.1 hypothetical protein HMI55_003903 [Coelomomyces lativittatus]